MSRNVIRFAQYFCAAGAAMVVNVGSRAALSRWLPFGASVVVAYCMGHLVNYVLSALVVFKAAGGRTGAASFLRFTLVAGGGLAVTFAVSSAARLALGGVPMAQGTRELAAHLAGVGSAFVCNYAGHCLFSFREKKSMEEQP